MRNIMKLALLLIMLAIVFAADSWSNIEDSNLSEDTEYGGNSSGESMESEDSSSEDDTDLDEEEERVQSSECTRAGGICAPSGYTGNCYSPNVIKRMRSCSDGVHDGFCCVSPPRRAANNDAAYLGTGCGLGGTCQLTNTDCSGEFKSGLCKGSNAVKCCQPHVGVPLTPGPTSGSDSVGRSAVAVTVPMPDGYTDIPLTSEHWTAAWKSPHKFTSGSSGPALQIGPAYELGHSTDTSAGLFLSTKRYSKDFDLRVVAKTCCHTRYKPNNWEVFWLYFNFNADQNAYGFDMATKTANAFYVGKSRYEVSTGHATLGQTFLNTGHINGVKVCPYDKSGFASCSKECSQVYVYRVKKQNQKIQVWWGEPDKEKRLVSTTYGGAKKLFDQQGRIGLYSEDAVFEVLSVGIKEL